MKMGKSVHPVGSCTNVVITRPFLTLQKNGEYGVERHQQRGEKYQTRMLFEVVSLPIKV